MVSVIIPVYNVEKYLEECFKSVAAQTYSDLEIVVVDDGSTDESGAICDAFAKRDGRVKVIHRENRGVSAARNAGLDNTHGEFVFFVDSDDFIEPDAIEALYEIQKGSGADLTIGMYSLVHEDGSHRKDSEEALVEGEISEKQFWEYAGRKYLAAVMPVAKLYRKSLFEGVRYPEGLINEDQYVLPDLIPRCGKIVCTNKVIYRYRYNDSSIMRKKFNWARVDTIEAYIRILQYISGKDLEAAEREYAQLGMRILGKADRCLKLSGEQRAELMDKYRRFKKVIRCVKPTSVKECLQISIFSHCFRLYSAIHKLRDTDRELL
ncbi:MAG: glycosyltransferase family 2 protein [Lachnospiraceae bacterium]|nr:glycosyltransferase family 2 protein [Lachnospiraceae bacterium]